MEIVCYKKISIGLAYESYAMQTIYMKYKALFSRKKISSATILNFA